jgi:transposase
LAQAYTNFFTKRASFPRFKKKGQRERLRYPQGRKLDQDNKRIFLPKLGWVRYRHSRDVLGTMKNVTVSKSAGKWFVSIQTSTTINKNLAMVCIEDLHIKNMSKPAAGTIEQPGKHVRAKSGLNKSILDQGWFEFRRQLDYKLAWRRGLLVAVPPHYTSQTCPRCGHVCAQNRLTQAQLECVQCSLKENADVVGALNILRAGHARLAPQASEPEIRSAAGTLRSDLGC